MFLNDVAIHVKQLDAAVLRIGRVGVNNIDTLAFNNVFKCFRKIAQIILLIAVLYIGVFFKERLVMITDNGFAVVFSE